MTISDITHRFGESICLSVGPFIYMFHAYDRWGSETLHKIKGHLACTPQEKCGDIDRHIHLISDNQDELPTAIFHRILPDSERNMKWQFTKNLVNVICHSDNSSHVLWSSGPDSKIGTTRFDFPWSLLIKDITDIQGGLIHAGLACHRQSGVLFLAPPTGGKTTTLSSAPPDWQVMSDDAALLWPTPSGGWIASPLPAWGMITNPDRVWPSNPIALDESCHVKSLLVLHKTSELSLIKATPSAVMPDVFCALTEYPVNIIAEVNQSEPMFRVSARLCRELECWDLNLPLQTDIWALISEKAA